MLMEIVIIFTINLLPSFIKRTQILIDIHRFMVFYFILSQLRSSKDKRTDNCVYKM